MSRIEKVKKNVVIGYVSQLITALAAFACRTVFIRQLDAVYLGVNGLFTNILGILSLAELGFGTAMNFEMYKPVAEKNYLKIRVLLKLYKRVYHFIALFILIGGIIVTPFLHFLIKEVGDIGNYYVFYVLYIVNTAAGYYASYLLCLTNAQQDEYISSLFSLGHTLLANILEIFVLIVFKSFYLYLFVWLISTIIQQILLTIYFRKRFEFVFINDNAVLDDSTKEHIKKNMGGLVVSKLSEVMLLQTDNIIIAMGMNIVSVGYADNYYLIISYLKKIVLSLLKSVIPSLGNLVATESNEKGYEVFKVYDFADYLIYAVLTVCLIVVFQPFISIWAGKEKVIDYWAMTLVCLSFYISGRNQSFMNYKTAYGIFYDMKITCIVSVLINIIVSVAGVFKLGLIGVYIGTCVSELYSNIWNLRLSYNRITGKSLRRYCLKRALQMFIIIVPIIVLKPLSRIMRPEEGWIKLIVYALLSFIVTLAWISVLFWKNSEYVYIRNIMKDEIMKIRIRKTSNE